MATKNKQSPVADSYTPGRKTKRQEKQSQQQEAGPTPQQRHKRRSDSMAWHQKQAPGESAQSDTGKAAQAQNGGMHTAAGTSGTSAGTTEAKHQLQAWGYESSQQWQNGQETHSGGEKWLWLCFVLFLGLVLLFSQRQWLARIFPSQSPQQMHLNVEIQRVTRPGEKLVADAGGTQNPQPEESPSGSAETGQEAGEVPAAEGNTQLAAAEPSNKVQDLLQRFDQLLRINVDEQEPGGDGQGQFRDVRLFFVKVEDDGRLQIKSVLHKVPFDQTPLSRTLEQLLKGPSPQEINKGLHSMLPPEMQILSIRIVNSTAFIDVSENFYEISQLLAVLLAAVKQLVFTVTEYPNIKSLRILVEGQPIFAESLPSASVKELEQKGVNLNSELRREDLWQGEMGDFALEP